MIWKAISDYPGYEISENGQIRRGEEPVTVYHVEGTRRKRVYLQLGSIRKSETVARLVAKAFIGPPPFKRAMVCHCDGIEFNDHYTNLRWDTAQGNSRDALLHKELRHPRGIVRNPLKLAASDLLAKDSYRRATTRPRRGRALKRALKAQQSSRAD